MFVGQVGHGSWVTKDDPFPSLLTTMVSMFAVCILCSEGVQYCQWETFNASCASQPGHVILMTSARYGRMRFGRCMREDHGSVGCSADVLDHLDRRCSGRATCQLSIPDATLHANHPCPKELMPYLEASYSCVKRELPIHFSCFIRHEWWKIHTSNSADLHVIKKCEHEHTMHIQSWVTYLSNRTEQA